MMRYFPFILLFTLIYLMLTANLEWLNIFTGVLIAMVITWLLKPRLKTLSWHRVPTATLALIQYLGILVYDIINPAIIAIPSGCDSELATALSAHAISVSPGEVVVEIDEDGVMYTHVLDVTQSAEYKEHAQSMRRELLSKIID
jgi:multicomponent Na+:H+ antiporter subunit E